MCLFSLQSTAMSFLLFGLLCVPSIAPHTEGSQGMSQTSLKNTASAENSVILHSLTISGLSSKDLEKNIILDSPVRLKLECILNADSLQISNITWKHGEEELNRDLYLANITAIESHTTLEVLVSDVNSTGSYSCVFTSSAEAKATFYIKAPGVHGGGKTVVTYNGDITVLKCDSYNYEAEKWLWYRVSGNEKVLLNISSESSRYKEYSKTANVTKLQISDLSEEDGGTYICKAVFKTGESEGQVDIKVLSLMAPFKVFLAIVVEVVILVAIILGYELLSKKKKHSDDDVKSEDEQMAHLKSEENGKSETSSTRQRKV